VSIFDLATTTRFGAVWFVGLFWRVQSYRVTSAVCRRSTNRNHSCV